MRTMSSSVRWLIVPVLLVVARRSTLRTTARICGWASKPGQIVRNKDNFLMKKKQFALSYSNDRGTPNWVSWMLHKDDLGNARKPFFPDTTLPRGFRRITPRDYTDSGFDRGHMCPHSDRADTPENSAEPSSSQHHPASGRGESETLERPRNVLP